MSPGSPQCPPKASHCNDLGLPYDASGTEKKGICLHEQVFKYPPLPRPESPRRAGGSTSMRLASDCQGCPSPSWIGGAPHYKGAKGRKSPSEGVKSRKTGDQRLMLNAAIHQLIHHPSITASLKGDFHPYKKHKNFVIQKVVTTLQNANYVPVQNL